MPPEPPLARQSPFIRRICAREAALAIDGGVDIEPVGEPAAPLPQIAGVRIEWAAGGQVAWHQRRSDAPLLQRNGADLRPRPVEWRRVLPSVQAAA